MDNRIQIVLIKSADYSAKAVTLRKQKKCACCKKQLQPGDGAVCCNWRTKKNGIMIYPRKYYCLSCVVIVNPDALVSQNKKTKKEAAPRRETVA